MPESVPVATSAAEIVHRPVDRRRYARFDRRKGSGVDIGLQQQASYVLAVLSRAQKVFGGDRPPADPPAFVPPPDLEQNLGCGWF